MLTEEIFSNAGCHKEAEAMQKMREEEKTDDEIIKFLEL